MTNIIQNIFRGIISVITTFVLMAAPIAALVYSSESTLNQVEYTSAATKYTVSWQTQTNESNQVWTMQQKPASEQTIAMAKKAGY